ncbi:hypothetical protein L6452_02894 [Arctium lappa]|uniref:Uncharacterized protein n=1 Tax=Arctium lappa TaxID=4217 RepID=A0ACB9FKV2_ARCLA|nr:hypothetical protein L6452_02894 [Arctium lappa]
MASSPSHCRRRTAPKPHISSKNDNIEFGLRSESNDARIVVVSNNQTSSKMMSLDRTLRARGVTMGCQCKGRDRTMDFKVKLAGEVD